LIHPLIPTNYRFDSWLSMCEYVMDVAEDEAKRLLNDAEIELIGQISDEIIATAQECEPKNPTDCDDAQADYT
jgi:hypothetical protein